MANTLVNAYAGERLSRIGYTWAMEPGAVADRIEQILRERDVSARAHSVACGLSTGTISILLGRLRGGDPLAVEVKTLAKIAEGSGVSLKWLLFGEEDEHPERAAGAAEARRAGVKEEAIASVLRDAVTPEQRGWSARRWMLQMQVREVEMLPPSGEIPKVQRVPPPKSSAPASGRRPSAPPSTNPFEPDLAPSSRAPVHESGEIVREIDPRDQNAALAGAAKKRGKS